MQYVSHFFHIFINLSLLNFASQLGKMDDFIKANFEFLKGMYPGNFEKLQTLAFLRPQCESNRESNCRAEMIRLGIDEFEMCRVYENNVE